MEHLMEQTDCRDGYVRGFMRRAMYLNIGILSMGDLLGDRNSKHFKETYGSSHASFLARVSSFALYNNRPRLKLRRTRGVRFVIRADVVPAGTQPGMTLVMAKKGVPYLGKPNGRGEISWFVCRWRSQRD
ncbi:hypothetical protein MUK42_10557 [Musa troglodytarum]|uniref:Uncharacterized protein n=1 Tax=Musa troglodytarum TaxID=320322 RepID=A0A9E7GI37_9LILI|nr:hypothetical protein MUK42_10557 [Musa troglodytarum]